MADWMKIAWAVLGVYLIIQVISSITPFLFAKSLLESNTTLYPNSFYNTSVWGNFGSAILPTIFPLLVAVGIFVVIVLAIWKLAGSPKGGKSGYGI